MHVCCIGNAVGRFDSKLRVAGGQGVKVGRLVAKWLKWVAGGQVVKVGWLVAKWLKWGGWWPSG